MEIDQANFMTRMGCLASRAICSDVCLGLSLILLAPSVLALGLGEIRVASKLGEHFVGRIPIIASPRESIDASCFKLLTDSPNKQDGVPFMDSARLTVNAGNGVPYIRVSSRKRIDDLIVRLAIKSGCESETTREYTILLDLPDSAPAQPDLVVINEPVAKALPSSQSILPVSTRAQHPIGPEWEVVAGDSLASIAASLYPNSQRMQKKFVRQAVAANPEIPAGKNPDALLPEGAILRVPDLSAPSRKSVKKEAVQAVATETVPPSEKVQDAPRVSRKSARVKKSGSEVEMRLKLTTSDLDVSASGNVTEGEREILREKQRILMDLDDMAAYNLSLNHRLKDMEAHIQELNAKMDVMDRQRSEMSASRPAAPLVAGTPPVSSKTAWEWPANANIFVYSGVGLGLLVVLILMWRRKRAETEELMGLDVDSGREWEEVPEPKTAMQSALLSGAVPADMSVDRQVEPGPAEVIEAKPAMPAVSDKTHGVDVDEVTLGSIECAIEEADIYIALGEGARAISNLKYHIESEPNSTADLWLKLLGIYHDLDMKAEFETLAVEFHEHFNIETPTWENMAFGVIASGSIEQFPHLMEGIAYSWGRPACLEYLNNLLLDNRGGLREGFELGIASDILLLIRIQEILAKFDSFSDDGRHSSEKSGAMEFVFEPVVTGDHEDVDVASHDDDVNIEPEAKDLPLLEFESESQVSGFPVEALISTESNQEIAVHDIEPNARTDRWRELLEIYRDSDSQEEFESFAKDLSLNFNIATPSWGEVTAKAKNTLSIGHFPSLVREINALWGTDECHTYLYRLLFDVRDGKRKGFDLGVSTEIVLLLYILERELNGDLVPELGNGQSFVSEAVEPEFSFELPGAGDEAERSDLGLPILDFSKIQEVEAAPVQPAEPAEPASTNTLDPRSALERLHFRIIESLILIWGEPAAANYLESLVTDERGGRVGFDVEVMTDLMMLYSLAGPAEVADKDVADIWVLSEEKELAAQNALKSKKH